MGEKVGPLAEDRGRLELSRMAKHGGNKSLIGMAEPCLVVSACSLIHILDWCACEPDGRPHEEKQIGERSACRLVILNTPPQ